MWIVRIDVVRDPSRAGARERTTSRDGVERRRLERRLHDEALRHLEQTCEVAPWRDGCEREARGRTDARTADRADARAPERDGGTGPVRLDRGAGITRAAC